MRHALLLCFTFMSLTACQDSSQDTSTSAHSPTGEHAITGVLKEHAPHMDLTARQGFEARLDAQGVMVLQRSGQASLNAILQDRMTDHTSPIATRLTGWGRGTLTPEHQAVSTHRSSDMQRFTLEHARGLQQWYHVRKNGLEHGFVVHQAPESDTPAPLSFTMSVQGGTPVSIDDNTVAVQQPEGQWRYDGLKVWDANGRALHAWMDVPDASTIRINVDDAHAAYPITVDPTWTLETTIEATVPGNDDQFGSAVAIQGGRAIVGAPLKDLPSNNDAGSAYIFTKTGNVWSAALELTPTGLDFEDAFGTSVDIDGDVAVVGAPNKGPAGNRFGAVYVFERSGVAWNQVAILTSSDLASGDLFGQSVSVSNNTIVVGAPEADAPLSDSGAAYVFTRDMNGTWSETTKLIVPTATSNDNIGEQISLDGDVFVISARGDDTKGSNAGAAYVFTRTAGLWGAPVQLLASDGQSSDRFGQDLSLAGNTIVVGAPDEDTGSTKSGAAYVFEFDGTLWNELIKLKASVPVANARFGEGVAVTTNELIVGAYRDSANSGSGSVYTFERSMGSWVETAKISKGATGDYFGQHIGLDKSLSVIGAPRVDNSVFRAGVAYIYNGQIAPVATNSNVSTQEDIAVATTLDAVDGNDDPLTYIIVTPPANGSLSGTAPDLTYTPNANFNGTDFFTFKVNDGAEDSNTATVEIKVDPANDAPVAQDGVDATLEDNDATGTLVALDVDADPLTYSVVAQPANGMVVLTGDSYTYTPNANFNGTDSFTFIANDGTEDSNIATITITVSPVNDAPVAQDGSATALEDNDATGTLVALDVDADPLTYSVVAQPANGMVVLTGDSYTYTPNANFNGTDSFTFIANDGTEDSNIATITISITSDNDAPVAENGVGFSAEDAITTGTLLASDDDADPLTYNVNTQPANGMVMLTGDSYTYTPNANFNGTDSFTFVANDGTEDSNVATIIITVSPVNDTPVAQNGNATGTEDNDITGTLVGLDVDGDTLTYNIITQPSNGAVMVNTVTGEFTYTPASEFNGTDSFTFSVNDGTEDSNVATITLDVASVNDLPLAQDASTTTAEDTDATGTLVASDNDGDPLTYSVVAQPSNGMVVLTGDSYTYTPNQDYNGTDAFTFKANDGQSDSNTATITITVTPENDAPVAIDGALASPEDMSTQGTLLASDVDSPSLTYSIDTTPTNGMVTIDDATTGAYTYTPDANFSGNDSFTFKVNDGQLDSNVATITITVTNDNDAPMTADGTLDVVEDTATSGVLEGMDPDGDTLTYSVVMAPIHGMIVIDDATTGAYTYTPNANFNGMDSFTFKANDGQADSALATVTITVTPENDAPVALDATLSTPEDTPVDATLTAADVDMDNQTFQLVTMPSEGMVTLDANTGIYTYTPNANFNGTDSFTFIANDGQVDSAPATITITVTPSNDAPVATLANYNINEDTLITETLTGLDVDADPLTFAIDTMPNNGTLTLVNAATGDFTYLPDSNYNGTDSFTFTVSDLSLTSLPATVTINVGVVNDLPVVTSETIETQEDTPYDGTLTAQDNDGDALTFNVVTGPTQGTLDLDLDTGDYTYTPNQDYNGPDFFEVLANDATADGPTARIDVTVLPVNDPPVFIDPTPAQDATVTIAAGMPATIDFLAEDPDGDVLTYTVNDAPTGAVVDENARTLTWTPTWEDEGSYTITIVVDDGELQTTRTIIIVVTTADTDGDNVPDSLEVLLGTDPNDPDSDNDFIDDGVEIGDLMNPANTDNDDTIDALDTDSDNDGIPDAVEAGDEDLTTPPLNSDDDDLPDFQDPDSDDDTILDTTDNCPLIANIDQEDADEDGIGDACDNMDLEDEDMDGIPDREDNCPTIANPDQQDSDNDGTGDACEFEEEDGVFTLGGGYTGCSSAPTHTPSPLQALLVLACGAVALSRRRRRA